MNLTDNNTTYVIPLDAIDLNYITKTNYSNGELSLWNGSNHSSREYYEFKIMAQKIQESSVKENGDCFNDPMYKCHVCNINIPLGYKKQHASSPKHKTCLKILETAMDRTKKLLQAKDDNDSVRSKLDSYFCESCAVAVNTSKREEHELSKDHFKSLQHDRFLNDLLMIYVEKSHLDNVDFEYMTKANLNSDEQDCDSVGNVDCSVSNNDDEIDNFMNLMEYLNEVSDEKESGGKGEKILEVNVENVTKSKHDNEAINMKDYIEILTSSSHSSLSPKFGVKGDKVEIETTDKSIIYVSEDHFHGFAKNNNSNIIHCKLCDVVFVNEVRHGHKMSPEHMKKVLTPISDMHGIRQVNQLNKHCVLCNVSVNNVEEHKTSEDHINILRKALSQNVVKNDGQPKSATTTAVKPNKTYCSPCGVYVDTHNFTGHTSGKKHKENVTAASTAKNNTNLPTAKKVVENTANKTFCATCKIYLDKNNSSSHFNGQRHKTNLTVSENNKNDGGQTEAPDTNNEWKTFNININQYASHIGGKNHKSKLFTLTDIEKFVYTSTKTGKVCCRICNVSVTTNDKNLTEHSRGYNHTLTFENLVSKYKIVKLNNRLVCGKCKQQFDVKSFFDHIQTHEARNLRVCRICNIQFIDTPEGLNEHRFSDMHENNLEEYDHPHLLQYGDDDDDDDEYNFTFVLCEVCDIDIEILESKAHVKSPSHLNKLNLLLHENKVLIREDFFICTICSLVIEDVDGIYHMKSDLDHKIRKNRMKNYDSITCIFCNIRVPYSPENIKIHENGSHHKTSFKNVVEMLDFDEGTRNKITHSRRNVRVEYLND